LRQGELSARLDDIARVRSLLTSDVSQALVEGLTVLFGFSILAMLSGPLALIAALLSLAIYGILLLSAAETGRRSRELAERSADVSASAVEVFGAIRAIRQFAADDIAVGHVMRRVDNAFERSWAAGHWTTSISTIVALLARAAFVAALAMSGVALVHRTHSVGSVIGALFVSSYLLSSVISVGRRIQQMLDARIALERLCEITEFPGEEGEANRELFHTESDSGLVFRDVVFRYGARELVINGFSLECGVGTITALLGVNGSGKSTLLDLAQGLYPIESGAIHANGIPVHQLTRDLRAKLIGVVAQDNPVFAGSLAANIALGDASPDLSRVAMAVSRVGLSAFVSSHRQGVHMLLGERGASVSGGQRQMLGLARALYRDPKILLLDEPSSSLDSVALATLRDLLLTLREEQKTILIVSHQPWALAIADAACILENGKARHVSRGDAPEQFQARESNEAAGPLTKPSALFSI
jgi:ATP-binding cassette subfamily B protein